ncbi:nucleotide sugar dehydrogenase [Ferruginivarius sediminum]|uniref:Nucleotide sugar dehydrogenase n=1 Tax=Ferruginivarius sediminum TaxID=2661937 RepID=A0A369TGR3_9PROT|nr:nucleotide sugar dehydrogenase [Ferruginivarius sediminum]RDD63565.1 nucleotide sugar dehydrogenase [Ferruginivarius sediminum]
MSASNRIDSLPNPGDAIADDLIAQIERRSSRVGIIGMGYVGLPLAQSFAAQEFDVVGFDVDSEKVAQLNRGESYIRHIPSDTLDAMCRDGRFHASSEPDALRYMDIIIMCVPTPLTRYREPDIRAVEASTRMIAERLRPGQLVILESTTYPGTTDEVVKPILEATGLLAGREFFLAYSPEREDPGNAKYRTVAIPKVVGADDDNSRRVAECLYNQVVVQTVPVSNSRTAEAIKLTENIFRSVNIALANELKVIFTEMGIDVWEVVDAAKTKPFGFMPFYPGPGLGGHCIPIDPFYLTWKAREYEIATRFVELAGQINTSMPRYVIDRLAKALDERFSRGLNGARILICGIAYKKNVDDIRESPALRLIELLEERGAHVSYHDPYVPTIPQTREHGPLAGRTSEALAPDTIGAYDGILICTDHDDVDYRALVDHGALVVDSRNILAKCGLHAGNVVKA